MRRISGLLPAMMVAGVLGGAAWAVDSRVPEDESEYQRDPPSA